MTNDQTPRIGMLATIRNRRGVISAVEPLADPKTSQLLHLVTVEFSDADGDAEESLLWERELNPRVIEPNALPRVSEEAPMKLEDFFALQRAARWSALTPFLSANSPESRSEPVPTAPIYGAVSVDNFQMVPLARAMRMPRVSLLIADDVGLGKTIEAGLILAELIRKRRIRRVLILTPAALRTQWQQEMEEKFSLGFDIVDKAATHKLQKEMGLEANPWRAFPRVITSYHYLRQPDVLEQFIANCQATREQKGGAQLPWDLLIVDEAHNLMPSNFGEDSDLANMLRLLTPWFEHRLFLTATPHNGHTRCFSGLLEQLDPVRFTRTPKFTDKERNMVGDLLIRRLKSEINEQDQQADRPPRFAKRYLEPLPLYLLNAEKDLSKAVREFCGALKNKIQTAPEARMVLNFAIEILRKRLLSSPVTFADSWLRFKHGLDEKETSEAAEVMSARRATEEDIDDDLERESRSQHASKVVGAWMHPFAESLAEHISDIDKALNKLGLTEMPVTQITPEADARFDRLKELVDRHLRNANQWNPQERLIIFTEYKTTLDYIVNRLKKTYKGDGAIIQLFGGMKEDEREGIKQAFNDPDSGVQILVATDAASEGLNLQHTARLLLHYEIPWNPSRLEQRNGRIDRHGQARDVTIFHFASDDDADLNFVARILVKVNEIREDLGSVGELFDAAFQRRMMELNDDGKVLDDLERQVKTQRNATDDAKVKTPETGEEERKRLEQLFVDLDLNPANLQNTLAVALGMGEARETLEGPDTKMRVRLRTPLPTRWQSVVDDTMRLPAQRHVVGALPWLVFDNQFFIQSINGRPVFRPSNDTLLLHLGHPVFRHALNTFARLRFPGAQTEFRAPSRWAVTQGQVPDGADALIMLTVEEMAVNSLRETFHHWVRTLVLPVTNGKLGQPLPYNGPHGGEQGKPCDKSQTAQELWDEVEDDIRQSLNQFRGEITNQIKRELEVVKTEANAHEKEAFQRRINEVAALQKAQSIDKIKREIEELRERHRQLDLLEDADQRATNQIRDLEDELKRRQSQFGDLGERLKSERDRILNHVIPHRYTLRGEAQVFPVTIEIRLPEGRA